MKTIIVAVAFFAIGFVAKDHFHGSVDVPNRSVAMHISK